MITAVIAVSKDDDLELMVAATFLKLAAAQAFAEQAKLHAEVRVLNAVRTLLALLMGNYGAPFELDIAVRHNLSFDAVGLLDAAILMREMLEFIELCADMNPSGQVQ